MDQPQKKVDVERYFESVEMPDYLAKLSDEELFEIIRSHSEAFTGSINSFCFKNGINDYKKQELIEVEAIKQGLILYGGFWVQPLVVFPNRFKRVIDDHAKSPEIPEDLLL